MGDRLQNRKRCLACKNHSMNQCTLFANTDIGSIDKCILEYDEVKSIQKDSIEEFIFYNAPVTYLQFLGKGKSLEVGDRVMTLRLGFGSLDPGKLLTVTSYNDDYYWLKDEQYEYGVHRNDWYMYVFKLDT
jgi:hypothetical protein